MEGTNVVISKVMDTSALASTLKNTVQEICTKLSSCGEESFFLSINLKDYSSTCFGSTLGKDFFMGRLDVIAQFYDYCKVHVNQTPVSTSLLKNTLQEETTPDISYQEEVILDTNATPVSDANIHNVQSSYYDEIIKNVCATLDPQVNKAQENVKPKIARMITSKKTVRALSGSAKKAVKKLPDLDGNEPCACILCGKKFAGAENLKAHMAVHTGGKGYRCHICDKGFEKSENLRQHERIHLEHHERPFSCSICDKKFTRKWILKTHMNYHLGHRPFDCNVCGKTFITRSSLNLHKSFHGEKKYECEICGNRYTRPDTLKLHMNMHMGKDLFECLICNKSWGKKSHLARHMKVHNAVKKERKKPVYRERKPKEKKRHICDICDKEFQRNYHLMRHMKVHLKKQKEEKNDTEKDEMENRKTDDPERMLVKALSLTRKIRKPVMFQDEKKSGGTKSADGKHGENNDDEENQEQDSDMEDLVQAVKEKIAELDSEEDESESEVDPKKEEKKKPGAKMPRKMDKKSTKNNDSEIVVGDKIKKGKKTSNEKEQNGITKGKEKNEGSPDKNVTPKKKKVTETTKSSKSGNEGNKKGIERKEEGETDLAMTCEEV